MIAQDSVTSVPELYVIGAGGHGTELHAYLEDLRCAGWRGQLKGYLDDVLARGRHGRLEVVGPIDGLNLSDGDSGKVLHYITAVGSNSGRRKVVGRIEQLYERVLSPWTLVHPAAYIGGDVHIGEGTCVAPGAILTARLTIGRHCIVNVKASVSHDCSVGDFANINPAATICGWVTIGEGAFIGAGSTIKDRVSIGAWSIIGAGAMVLRDIPPNVTVVGVPARIVKYTGSL
jgi:sugar O-acyltransferase (sialic acid O-acetyltransferase NeuD family)